MLTFHPTLSLKAFIKALVAPSAGAEARLAQLFPAHTIILTDSGRSALALTLEALDLRGKRIALPAYLCDNILPVFEAFEVTPVFLDSDHGFAPDLSAYQENLDAAIVVATYGALPDPTVIRYLKNRDIKVIEDHAHMPLLDTPANFDADARYYSFAKTLPVPNGGMAVLPRTKPMRDLPRSSGASLSFLKDVLKLIPFFNRLVTKTRLLSAYTPHKPPSWTRARKMPPLSKRFLAHALGRATSHPVAGFRYCYPLLLDDPKEAQRKLFSAGIIAERIWDRLIIDAADVRRLGFPNADQYAGRVLCVPLWHLNDDESVARYERELQDVLPDDFAGFR